MHAMEQYVQLPSGRRPAGPLELEALLRDEGKMYRVKESQTSRVGYFHAVAFCVVLAESVGRVNSPQLAALEAVVLEGREGGGEVVPDVHDGLVVDLSQLRRAAVGDECGKVAFCDEGAVAEGF